MSRKRGTKPLRLPWRPRILRVEELPQWITESDIACYDAATHTIWLSARATKGDFLHEWGHHIIEIVTGYAPFHRIYDKIVIWLKGRGC